MSRRTILCEKLTGDTRSLIWTDSRRPGYRHDTRDTGTTPWTYKHTLFVSTVLAAVINVTAKYLSIVGSTRPAGHALVSCQHEATAAPTRARAGSQLGTDHAPLFVYVRTEGINRGQSSNTWKQQQLD